MAGLGVYSAEDLYRDLVNKTDFRLLDVRNEDDFVRFQVESPYSFEMSNVPYIDFIEDEKSTLGKIPKDKPIKIVCAKEGSAKYVGDILSANGFGDVSYLSGGIKTWGDLLVPVRINHVSDEYSLYQFIRPGKACLSYGIVNSGQMAVLDPSRNIDFYREFARSENATITQVLETHAHADHLSGGIEICSNSDVEMLVHKLDFPDSPFNYVTLDHLEKVTLCDFGPEMDVYHTPGHTEGSLTYLIDGKYLITGDTLFIISAGRPDLAGKVEEWVYDLYKTIIYQYAELPGDASVLPAHYVTWQETDENLCFSAPLEKLRENNPIFSLTSENEFAQFIFDNMRDTPEVYNDIKQVNRGLMNVTMEEADIMDLGKNECAASHYDSV